MSADFRNLVANGCVDCLQADVTRCGGITGFLGAGAIAVAFDVDLSAHCAPSASVAACCAVPNFRPLEYFHDHVRLEPMLFDGVLEPQGSALRTDRSRPGNGLELKRADAKLGHRLQIRDFLRDVDRVLAPHRRRGSAHCWNRTHSSSVIVRASGPQVQHFRMRRESSREVST